MIARTRSPSASIANGLSSTRTLPARVTAPVAAASAESVMTKTLGSPSAAITVPEGTGSARLLACLSLLLGLVDVSTVPAGLEQHQR